MKLMNVIKSRVINVSLKKSALEQLSILLRGLSGTWVAEPRAFYFLLDMP